jgi:hypothetical protein
MLRQPISHYRIISKLGKGCMRVFVKMLPSTSAAIATAFYDHPRLTPP